MDEAYREFDSWTSKCGCARISYHKEWSASRPFATFKRGTAGAQYPTLRGAMAAMEASGFRFDKPQPCPLPSDPEQRLDITCAHCGTPIGFHHQEVYVNGTSYTCKLHAR